MIEKFYDKMVVQWRRGRAGLESPLWENPFQSGILRIKYREKDVPKSYRNQTNYWRKGDPCSIMIEGMYDWAEYVVDDLEKENDEVYTLLTEDYYCN